ncbi:MAG TPA: SDR family oxidoreductase [Steroidobacteraceae bacterium]|nr:SDR family oxidoreductase [Steroidobacteraceae bacterium]
MANRLTDKIVLVTGAAGGLGRAYALAFAQEGARLIVTDVEASGLEETAALLGAQGAFCSAHRVDLAVEKEIQEFGAELGRTHPRLDVLINNAGIAYGEITTGFEKLSQEKWLKYLAVNTLAPLLLAQALRAPLSRARGLIINQSSMASYVPASAYGLTKSALNAMTFGMAYAFGADGIRVNAIAPGLMETPASNAHLTPEQLARVKGMQLLPLHGTAQDIAALGVFLASEEGRFINNDIISCDAGNRMRGYRG